MASYDAAINLIVNGGSKIDQIINKAAQLEGIVNSLNKTPLDLSVKKATSEFDKFDTNLKALKAEIGNQQKALDAAAGSIDTYTDKIASTQRQLSALNPNTKKYNEVLERQQKAIEGLAGAQKSLASAEQNLAIQEGRLAGTQKAAGRAKATKLATEALSNLADEYLRLGAAQEKGATGQILKNQSQSTIARLNAQAEALKLVADNSEIASSQFNRFAIASQLASQKIYEGRQKQLGALAFGLSKEAPGVNIGTGGKSSIAAARDTIDSLIGSYGGVVKSEAALSSYISRLQSLQSLVPYLSEEYNKLERAIGDVSAEMESLQKMTQLRGAVSKIQPQAGPASLLPSESVKSAADKTKYYSKIDDQVSRLAGFEERIAQANLTQVQKVELRSRLDRALSLLAENRLEDAKRETVEIERQRMSLERMNRAGSEKPQGLAVELGGGAELRERNKYEAEQVRLRGQIAEATNTAAAAVQRLEAAQGRISMVQQFEEIQSGIKSVSDEVDAFLRKDKQALSEFDKKLKETSTVIKQVKQGVAVDLGGGAEVRERAKFEESTEKNLRRRNSILASGAIIEQGLYNLRSKGVNVDQTLEGLQRSLNAAKLEEFEITSRTLDALSEQVSLAGKYAQLQRTALAGQPGTGGKKAGPEGTGLEAALKKLEEARAARQKFLGSASPAQAIDQIVREFNKGKPGGGAGANVVNTLLSEASAGVPKAAVAGEQLGKAVEEGLNDGLGIQSPSKVAIEAMLNVVNTLVNTAKSGKVKVQAALEDLVAPKLGGVQKAPLLKSLTAATEDTIEKLSNFIGRTSAKPSLYRPLARLAGPELLSGGAVPQAMQRKAFEAGKILPETGLLPLSERRILRRSANAPGSGLESEVLRAAIKGVSGTGAFVGPLASSVRGQGAVASRLFPALSQGPAGVGGTGIFPIRPQPRVGAPGSAFPFQSYRMSGAQQFPADEAINLLQKSATRGDANRALADAISRYRDAVNNFWEGEDSQFEAISKVVKSSAQVGGAKLARKFTESGRGAGLSEIADVVSGEKELGVSRFVGQSTQRISDSILNSIEPLAYSIGDSFKDGIDKIRNAVPGLVSRGLSVASGAIGGGGGRPPLPPSGGGGETRDPGEFGRRLSQAADQGADALLGLRELRDPSKATTVELEALSAVLKEFRNILDPTVEGFDRLEKQLRESAAGIDRQLERRDPDADFLTRRFGPRGGRAVSEGLVGGAFPLLFGQGAGASLGGLVGGAAGGFAGGGLGFGLSLIGTALGTTFDTFVQSAKDLASALERPVENFDELKTAAFFSSKELERSIQRLIDFGDKASASAAIQEEAIKKIGVNGVKNLAYLGSEADRLNRAWSELGQQMQALIAGPLASFISTINQVVGPMVQAGRVEALRGSLSGAQQQELDTELNRAAARGTYKPTGKMSSTAVEVLARFEPEKVQAILDKWQPVAVKGKIKITEKERLESEINALQKQLEVIDIAKGITAQVRQAAREQEDLDRQRADLARSYEESIASIRQRVEDEIASKRFATLQKENELFDLQGQIRLKSLEISNRSAIAQAGTGQRPEVEQAAKEVAGIVADFTQQQLEAEEEAAKIKRDAALDAQKIDFEGAKFKADIEKEVSRLNIETARKVSDINLQVARRNEEYDDRRFEIEKKINDLKLLQMQNELSLITRDVSASELTRRLANQTFGELTVVRRQLAEQQPPARLRGVGAVGGGGVSTSGLDKATAGYKTAIQNFVNAQLELNKLTATSSSEDFKNRIDTFIKQVGAPLEQNIQSAIDADKERLAYARAINEGMTEAQARRALEIQQAVTLADLTYEAAIAELERRKAMKGTTDAMREQIDIAIERLEITREKSRDQMSGLVDTAVESERGKQIFDFIIQTKAQLNDLESYAVRVSQGIGDAIGNSLSTGIAGLIEGTTAAKEVFGNFLKDMGMMLIEEGTKMIAMYIAIGVAKLFAGFSGGSTGGAGATPGVNVNPAGTGIQTIPVVGMPAANGAYFDGATAYFAKGGIVGSPTLFQFADGGTMQTGLMGEAGPEAIMPLRRTPDGRLGVEAIPFQGGSEEASADAAIPFQSQSGGTTVNNFQQLQSAKIPFTKSTEQLVSESRERETVSAINNPKPLDVRFESQVINGVEYVTAEQHQRGMAQAAERGRALTLASLQNSVKTRKQVGMS